jgi:two-component system, LytTR family, response regulator
VIPDELMESVTRIESRTNFRYSKPDLAKIFKAIQEQKDAFQSLAVPTKEGVEFLSIDGILRLEADGNYTFIYLKDGTRIYTSKILKYFEDLLPSNQFYRPHNSHIIAVDSMRKFVKSGGGYIIMSDGAHVSLARSKRTEFSARFYG